MKIGWADQTASAQAVFEKAEKTQEALEGTQHELASLKQSQADAEKRVTAAVVKLQEAESRLQAAEKAKSKAEVETLTLQPAQTARTIWEYRNCWLGQSPMRALLASGYLVTLVRNTSILQGPRSLEGPSKRGTKLLLHSFDKMNSKTCRPSLLFT